ncbi:MAG: AlkA N-terminal domain-containing protein [Pseudomonadota bacterium]
MEPQAYENARQSRDPRFDGRFFIGVTSTGVYCRPVCPVRTPRPENVRFFASAAAAAEAGFRPCLRCRPESAPGTPAWRGTSVTVTRGLRLINEGALDDGTVTDLATRLGVTSRHLTRLFQEHLGASPKTIALTRRLQFAKKLLNETGLPLTDIALASGYGSIRRFNDHFRQVYGRAPRELRRSAEVVDAGEFSLLLPFRPPFDVASVLAFLGRRAIPGVESVSDETYHRSIRIADEVGQVSVRLADTGDALRCSVALPSPRYLLTVLHRVRRLFDLDADPLLVNNTLCRDRRMARLVRRNPGMRVPGCWDPFEVAVRAIVGQQVSVVGATTIMGRIARQFGTETDGVLYFPDPESLAMLDPGLLPMPRGRAEAIRALALGVADGQLDFSDVELQQKLLAIKGIGPWTADYIAMRALGDPDAFLAGDLVLRRSFEAIYGAATIETMIAQAEPFRPWRAYAAMHLWAAAG